MTGRPDQTEAAEYYWTYIRQVPDGDIRTTLAAQADDIRRLLAPISEEASHRRYAPDKWSIREVLSHITDSERMFAGRAIWFARNLPDPLPSFDQTIVAAAADADARSLASHVDEFGTVRAATRSLFDSLPDAAWSRRGIASDNEVSVRALAWIIAGHAAHHVRILRERYLG